MTCGSFSSNPLSITLTTFPLQITYSRSGKPCVIVDLSFPHGYSVNTAIPASTYLSDPFKLCLPGVNALPDTIHVKGHHCHLFKMDLLRTIQPASTTGFLSDTVVYTAFLSLRTSSLNYIMNHLNAVHLLHLYWGFSAEPFNSFEVTLTRKGHMCMLGTSSHQKHPITLNMLVSIRHSLDLTILCHAALWA